MSKAPFEVKTEAKIEGDLFGLMKELDKLPKPTVDITMEYQVPQLTSEELNQIIFDAFQKREPVMMVTGGKYFHLALTAFDSEGLYGSTQAHITLAGAVRKLLDDCKSIKVTHEKCEIVNNHPATREPR
ncbi:MAG TPA: hypothetical protein VHO25_14550 [Polyangiaceae bacterium]|nr:hypothetical protein [Polyangiaceae bacterium]